ncbi:peptidylprolyl isomerase [uncultured Xylophilus sp.]|uniref:peptidylprolyl isomerase n=1 Tax=uncultured Xylophilus sp. TaxID=296832 RepID=UPI0025F65FFC|nr:peptidylprolyl isomerase [uncultured Xylophilus sp.]
MNTPFFPSSRRVAGLLLLAGALAGAGASAQTASPRVKLATSEGDIVLELNASKAPKTVDNFLQYVRDKHYDGTVFHRVIDGFMIQGGGFGPTLREKPARAPIAFETTGLKNDRGTIAMARTSNPNSATAQFFINVKDNAMLNPPNPDGYGYVVFGKVVSGMDVVDKIRTVATDSRGPHQNVPVQPVTINAATVVAP